MQNLKFQILRLQIRETLLTAKFSLAFAMIDASRVLI